ncbi:MAG: molybdopterin cofactor-binding domain-containing protein [Caldilineaceae bacterium]
MRIASAAMMLAETIGVAAEDINPSVVDTNSVGLTGGTGGSSVTFKLGWSTYQLGLALREKVAGYLAEHWDVPADSVKFEDGLFVSGDKKIGFKQAAQELAGAFPPITANISARPKGPGPGFATHIVDLEVDVETGKVQILRYTAVQDVGKAIHPSYVEGQIQGGVVQGIGWGLNEEYVYNDKGQLLNASLLDYRMPTAYDLPEIETVLVEVANPDHPYGVRGVGEVPIVPPAAAIANAIYQATGLRMTRLPMSPAAMLEAMWEREGLATGD